MSIIFINNLHYKLRVKIFVTTMNITNNHPETSDQASYNTDSALDPEDYYFVRQGFVDCCVINLLVFSCMVVGVCCLLNYDPNVNKNLYSLLVKSNSTDILNPFNKSNIFSV